MSRYNCNGCNQPPENCVCRARDDAQLLTEVKTWLRRKYVTRADARQREMGLSYVTAETKDLAKEIARFIKEREA